MVTFTSPFAAVPQLYVATAGSGDQGWTGYLMPAGQNPPGFELAEAFNTFQGCFLFGARSPAADPHTAAALVRALAPLLPKLPQRALCWLGDPNNVGADTVKCLLFAGAIAQAGVEARLSDSLFLVLASGSSLKVQGDALAIGWGSSPPVTWAGAAAPTGETIGGAQVPFSGAQRGCIVFDANLDRKACFQQLNWGMQAVYLDTTQTYRTGWFPLADGTPLGVVDHIPFHISIDPTDVVNAYLPGRTLFAFSDPQTILRSGYRTNYGQVVTLLPVVAPPAGSDAQPAVLVLQRSPTNAAARKDFVLAPIGDFYLRLDAPPPKLPTDDPPALLCGLAGSESITFQPRSPRYPGDRLRFASGKPAFAVQYPYQTTSPVGPPVNLQAPRLDTTFVTSWAGLIAGDGSSRHYCAQPKGANLYGKPEAGVTDLGVLLGKQPGYTLSSGPDFAMPLLPYGMVQQVAGASFMAQDYADVEARVIAPARRDAITQKNPSVSASPRVTHALAAPGDDSFPATTPSGLVVQVSGGQYTEVQLAQNQPQPGANWVTMQFLQPAAPLQQALQTSQLLLVVANADNLGSLVGWPVPDPPPSAQASFFNALTIEAWALLANVGERNRYGDYNNVLIIKGRKGKMTDLGQSPDLWTQPGFAIPGGEGTTGTTAELIVLSQWLQSYFQQAAAGDPAYFGAFNQLINDENWTGILVLKADIAQLPSDITGLLGGIDVARFNAHHFGITITPVRGDTVQMQGNSSSFGLIYYVDANFDQSQQPPQPVPPRPGYDYDFRVLTLKVLFRNAAVRSFESLAQLTLNRFFGQPVHHTGTGTSLYNSLILKGSLQKHDGTTSYILDTEGDTSFYFRSTVMNKAEVLKAQFSTVGRQKLDSGDTQVTARFDLWGFLDFHAVAKEDGTPYDIFSFGSGAADAPRQGLAFSGLGVNMRFIEPKQQGSAGQPPVFSFDPGKIAFDVSRSTPRPNSLFSSLALKVDGLVWGDDQNTPAAEGYLPVIPDFRLAGLKGPWFGLRLRADMGTPGALAGKVGLNSYILAAWCPDNGTARMYNATLGLALPGTGTGGSLLSLQGVLKLSVGPIRLSCVPGPQPGQWAFLLEMTELALKFLGLLKLPPNGATSFFLFGDPAGQGPLGWFALYNKLKAQ